MMSNKEIATQIGISTLKGAISAIPFIGGAINEYAFEARGRIKQERVNNFINNFSEYLAQFKEDKIDIAQIKKEEFGDFFEEVIIKVSKTHSEIKKLAIRNLLANQLLRPKEINYSELLLEIISNLHEKQIPILRGLNEAYISSYIEDRGELLDKERQLNKIKKNLKAEYWKLDSHDEATFSEIIPKLEEELNSIQEEIETLNNKIENSEKPWKSNTYNIPQYEFYFLIQDLCNKGLLVDNGMRYAAELYQLVEISQLGIDLIDSLSDYANA
ncbi:hypothetical protein [Flavobacterium sp. 245]|uniref:hypothetical protein n=1 Tax=Flavobacterium sp. 245 TaxID=2512115 RepID=UPI00105CE98D|nr:hypothetical protein [Flavobacterium sp. 245]TDP01549.1 hypothetical protein EV145_104258 [Flavobacterium sp. 245]